MSNSNRDPDKEAFWRLVHEEFEGSGLTVREFCRKEGLTESSFYAWKRLLKERDSEATPLGSNEASPSHVSSKRVAGSVGAKGKRRVPKKRKGQAAKGSNLFVPVEIVASPIASTELVSNELTIRTPAGFTIGLPPTVDAGRFGEIMDVLSNQPQRLRAIHQREVS